MPLKMPGGRNHLSEIFMPTRPNAKQNGASPMVPSAEVGRMPWDVVAVEALDGYRLWVRFADGVEGEVDMAQRVRSPRAGVFAVLADPDMFAKAHIGHGAVTWPGELDLTPDTMHDEIEKNGVWMLK